MFENYDSCFIGKNCSSISHVDFSAEKIMYTFIDILHLQNDGSFLVTCAYGNAF